MLPRFTAHYNEIVGWPGAHDVRVMERSARKALGIFVVLPSRFCFDYDGPDIQWRRGDRYLNLGLPPLSKDQLTLKAARDSYEMVAAYTARHDLGRFGVRAVCGLTNPRIARVAHRAFGFSVADVPTRKFPRYAVKEAKFMYDLFVDPDGKRPFRPVFVYQPLEVVQALGEAVLPRIEADAAQNALSLRPDESMTALPLQPPPQE